MRHTDGKIEWHGTNSNQSTYALNSRGARYTIDRFGGKWAITFLPGGTAIGGFERVPWLPGRQSLTTAKLAVEAHWEGQKK